MSYSTIKSILLVDDDQDDIYFFSKALSNFTDLKIDLMTAGDGIEAFEKLETATPDVILLDLNMPRMNGVTFLKNIKATKHLKDIPVIIYTTYVSVFDENELLKLGAYDVFIKPDEFNKTVQTISDILKMNFIRMTA